MSRQHDQGNDGESIDDILDTIINDPNHDGRPTIEVALHESPESRAEIARAKAEVLEEHFAQGRRDLEESVRNGMREEMDAVLHRRYRTPHKLDVARQELRDLAPAAGVDPAPWLERLERENATVGPVLSVVDGECRLALTDYTTLKEAAAVIPATVPDRGLVVLFEGRELRARNGRRFHKRAWTDFLDEGIIGPVRSSRGGMSRELQAILELLPGYSTNLRRWKET